MSRQDKLNPSEVETNGLPEIPDTVDRLHIDLRLGLDEIVAVEEERLRRNARRRPSQKELKQLARELYDQRRSRGIFFRHELLGEPGWDMLLALYALPARGILLGVTSLSEAAEVPQTTGLRWQKHLINEGLMERGPSLKDGRLTLVRLTAAGRLLMDQYLLRLYHCKSSQEPDTE